MLPSVAEPSPKLQWMRAEESTAPFFVFTDAVNKNGTSMNAVTSDPIFIEICDGGGTYSEDPVVFAETTLELEVELATSSELLETSVFDTFVSPIVINGLIPA